MTWNDVYLERRYETPQNIPDEQLMTWAISYFDLKTHPVILDVGCGAGRNAFGLAACGAIVHGCDSSTTIIDYLRKEKHEYKLASALVCPAENLSPYRDAMFDGVVCDGVLQYLPRHSVLSALHHISRVLKAGGHFFSSFLPPQDKRNVGLEPTEYDTRLHFLSAVDIAELYEVCGLNIVGLFRKPEREPPTPRSYRWVVAANKAL